MRILFLSAFIAFAALAAPSFAEGHATVIVEGSDTFDDGFFVEDEPIIVMAPQAGSSDAFIAAIEAHTIDVLKWQLRTSERILMMVMVLTAAGVVFAGYQLWHAMNPRVVKTAKADTDIQEADTDTTSSLSFGDGKFEVTSPIVGILILMIALGSLYFFLTFVYSIEVMPLL